MIDNSQCPAHTRTPWGEKDHRYDYRLRYIVMGILTATIMGVIIVAIVFLVDHGQHNWAQIDIDSDNSTYLMAEKLDASGTPFHPPFRACGDQLEDCQLFQKPFFCCAPTMLCHESKWSPSGLYCCADEEDCIVSKKHIPSCIGKTSQCSRELGGGCCPHGSTCSPNGCLETFPGAASFPKMSVSTLGHLVSPLNLTQDHAGVAFNQTLGLRAPDTNKGSKGTTGGLNASLGIKLRTEAYTPTQAPRSVFTGIKFGEVAFVAAACPSLSMPSHFTILLFLTVIMPLLVNR